jgi:hypothetical protein
MCLSYHRRILIKLFNRPMNQDADWVISRLRGLGTCAIELKDWSEALYLDVQCLLPKVWRDHLVVEVDEQRGWVHLTLPPIVLVPENSEVYPERSRWSMFAPLVWLGLIYVVIAHILGRGLLLGFLFASTFVVPFFPILFGALLSYAIQCRQPVLFQRIASDIFRMLIIVIVVCELMLIEQTFVLIKPMPLFTGSAMLLSVGGFLYIMLLAGAALMCLLCRWVWKPYLPMS